MIFQLHAVLLTVFAVLMVAAAVEDFRRLTIPNLVPAALCLLWPAYFAATAPSLYGALAAIGCALAVFLVGAALFARGWLGGGDVKLLAAATLWAGPAGTPSLLILTGMLGGAPALFLLLPVGGQMAAAARALPGPPPVPAGRRPANPVADGGPLAPP